MIRDCQRVAAREQIPFAFPPVHPFNPILALRLSLHSVAGDDQWRIIDALWTAGWAEEVPLANADAVADLLSKLGLDALALIENTQEPEVKAELRRNTDDAIAAGVLGVPSFRVGDEIIWGADRLDDVADAAAGEEVRARIDPIFARAAFIEHLGIALIDAGKGWVTTGLDIRPEHLQQDGVVHAGVVTTLADHSSGAAAGTLMAETHTP